MIVWGAVGNSHDASLAVANVSSKSTDLLWAGLARDFSDISNDPHLNQGLIEYAQFFGSPDEIIWYERPRLKTLRQWWAGQGWLSKENNIKNYFRKLNVQAPIKYTQHHLAHAAYAYYTQPHDDCAVICLDSIGEFETLTIWHGKNGDLKKVHSQGYPHSLGLFYSAMTQRIGLVPQRDEYLVAQWGAKGDPHRFFMPILNELVSTEGMGFNPKISMRENLHRGCSWWRPELTTEQDMYDIAAATQKVFEYCLLNLSRCAYALTKSKYVALAGGGAMNKQAVDLIRVMWHDVHIPKNPGDPGSCIGAILAKTKHRINLDNKWHR